MKRNIEQHVVNKVGSCLAWTLQHMPVETAGAALDTSPLVAWGRGFHSHLKGFGFVTYKDSSSVDKVLLDGPHHIDSKTMRQFPPCIPNFHGEKGQTKVAMRINVITLRTRLTGVMAGLVLSVFFYSDLILRCGDVELNPGPTKPGSSFLA
ncbi:hypothetical protein ACOMHN_055805 [Nucella lapillus]